jgi:hypothetical protein
MKAEEVEDVTAVQDSQRIAKLSKASPDELGTAVGFFIIYVMAKLPSNLVIWNPENVSP